MSRVLITGIEGFVGRHLACRAESTGHSVAGIYFSARPTDIPGELRRGDVRSEPELRSAIKNLRPDWIVHLAAISSVGQCEDDPGLAFEVNVVGTLRLLRAVQEEAPSARVLLVSSADVYGTADDDRPHVETDLPRPLSVYALSKLAAEQVGLQAHRTSGLAVIILRPFSHTGPGQDPRFVFPSVAARIVEYERASRARRAAADPRVVELGNLEVSRDYTDVRDIANAYLLALQKCRAGETYNIASGSLVRLEDAIINLCQLSRVAVTPRSSPARLRKHDIRLLSGDATKFRRETGWSPRIPIAVTLRDLLEHHRSLP